MMEWTVVCVIIALVGLIAAIVKPMMSLASTITTLNEAVKSLTKQLEDITTRNRVAHDALFRTQRDHNDKLIEHDLTLVDHGRRIEKIEKAEGREHPP